MTNDLSYRDLLKEVLLGRSTKNKRYSLRAFARDLGLQPSYLCRVLNKKQHFSRQTARFVAEKIFNTERDRNRFLWMLEYETARRSALRELALRKLDRMDLKSAPPNLNLEVMDEIHEWYHVALLDLTLLDHFDPNPAKIGQKLGIPTKTVELATERLLKLGLVTRQGDKLKKSQNRLVSPNNIPNASIRRFHRQMITKALESLETQSIENRYIVSSTITIDQSDLPELKTLADEFLEKAEEIAHRKGPKSDLYQLNVQLFNLLTGDSDAH